MTVAFTFNTDFSDKTKTDRLDIAAEKFRLAINKLWEARDILDTEQISQIRLGKGYLKIDDQLDEILPVLTAMKETCAKQHVKMKSSSKASVDLEQAVGLIHSYWTGTLGREFTHDIHRNMENEKVVSITPASDATAFTYRIIKTFVPKNKLEKNGDVKGLQTLLRKTIKQNSAPT